MAESNLSFLQQRDCRARLSYGVLTDCLARNDIKWPKANILPRERLQTSFLPLEQYDEKPAPFQKIGSTKTKFILYLQIIS